MGNLKISKYTLEDIANAARKKTGRSYKLLPHDISSEIKDIPGEDKASRDIQWILSSINTAHFPDSVTTIKNDLFFGCQDLLLTELPDTIKEIGASAFTNCETLALTKLPDSLVRIGGSAFLSCKKLALTKLPDHLETVEGRAFTACDELAIKRIPRTVKYMVTDAVYIFNSPKMTEITFEGTPGTLSGNVFSRFVEVLNVPWPEGAVANAPWGAVNATINYNYKEDANGNQDTVPV